ncbi:MULTISPECIES: serine protease [unclassified Caballeronia]|uniref:trypsin-like serine peptidase n=1 Tax=unclassified Caballeronia TaxID=2646786 RepID=UPI002861F6F2|nr:MULTISPECIES: serine protease [unclassified Caballeronia]MDR5753014.1 serine protease [Caballeronia sp. LZ024]MDR5845088.1 serine protease [Caballeronia sp. LZ031]
MNDASQTDFAKLAPVLQTATIYSVAIKDLSTFAGTFDEHVVRRLKDAGKNAPPPFEAIRASYGDDGAALMLAIQLTIQEQLQIELANALALAPGSLEPSRRLGLSSGAARSIAEGVLSEGASLEDVLHLVRIVRVARAVCLVKKGVESIGTGFLAARNLILTAAHVLLDHRLMDKNGPLDGFADLHFVFHNELESVSGTWPYQVRPAKHWRVSWSPACISDPNGHNLSPRSAERLDYVLIRIADAVPEHIAPIDIRKDRHLPDAMEEGKLDHGRRYFIIGHPGGSDCKFSVANLTGINLKAARLLHSLTTVAGMSGSPLIDKRATPLGLHEGKIMDGQGHTKHNRATMIHSILAHIEASPDEPFGEKPRVSTHFDTFSIRGDWVRYGARLAAIKGVTAEWTDMLSVAGMTDAGAGVIFPDNFYYPVFPAPDLDRWLAADAASLTSTLDENISAQLRVMAVVGGHGTGKSFALQVARARCAPEQLCVIPSSVATQLPLKEMAQQVAPELPFDERRRPSDGIVRSVYVEPILDHFDEMAAGESIRQFTIAVEFGDGAYWREVQPFWVQFAILCSQRSQLRLLICDPPEAFCNEMLLQEVVELSEPKTLMFRHLLPHVQALSALHGLDPRAAAERAQELWVEANRLGVRFVEFARIDAARIVFQVVHELARSKET